MKKSLLSVAVAAGVAAASAQAQMWVSPENTGQVLMYPVYTAENGNTTSVHIVNTTMNPKAVKVRFLEGRNSDEVLDFNLYLSRQDHFSFTVTKDPNGNGAAIVTRDNSCTVPELGSANAGGFVGTKVTDAATGETVRTQPFVNFLFASDTNSGIERSLVGHIEVIEMGTVDGTSTLGAAMTHGANGVPANCGAVRAAWNPGGVWATAPNTSISAPSGGLYGFGNLLNVSDAAAFGFEATAVDGFLASAFHSDPGNTLPSLASGVRTAIINHNGDLPDTDTTELVQFADGVEAISALIMATSISNDVMTNSAVAAQSDWVVTFPTKNLFVDTPANVVPRAPFTDLFVGGAVTGPAELACEDVAITEWDREEQFTQVQTSFSPAPPGPPEQSLCFETNMVTWSGAGASSTNASLYRTGIAFDFADGWARMSFTDAQNRLTGTRLSNNSTTTINGLPVIGFLATRYANGAMSYGYSTDHKRDVVISGS